LSFGLTYQNQRDGHSSGHNVTIVVKQPTRSFIDANNISKPIRSCTGWGLQASWICSGSGGLLHHPFTLTLRQAQGKPLTYWMAVYFLLHFPWFADANLPALGGILFCGARTFLSWTANTGQE